MARRGPYAKTAETREQVLQAALRMIAEKGLSSTTIDRIAESVGMTRPGLLHHFGSREKLLLAVIERSDEENAIPPSQDTFDALIALDRHNLEVPGLLALYLGLAGAAASEHGDTLLRTTFSDRYRGIRDVIATDLRAGQRSGRIRDGVDADVVAALIVAASDGLQMQRLLDDSVPAVDGLLALQALLTPARSD